VRAAGVHEPSGRNSRQPCAGVARRALGPRPQRLQQGLLQRVLGGIEVLAPPDQPCQHLRDQVPLEPGQFPPETRRRRSGRGVPPPAGRLLDHAASVVSERSHMTSRTSIHSYSGSPPGPGSEEK
jgi:hypothetical protein